MSDAIFNTLVAVALMCSAHSHAPPGDILGKSMYDAGFEACATVDRALAGERDWRERERRDATVREDRRRLLNALAALSGKKFEPEQAPITLRPTSPCVIETYMSGEAR